MSGDDELRRLEEELLRLNAQVDQKKVVALADEALSASEKPTTTKLSSRSSLLSPAVQSVLNASRARQTGGGSTDGDQSPSQATPDETPESVNRGTSGQTNEQPHEQNVAEEDIFELPDEVGMEGKVRLQKARINVLTKESRDKTQRIKILEKKVSALQSSENKLKTANSKLEKQSRTHQQSLDRVSRQLRETKEKYEAEQKKVFSLESELREYTTSARKRNGMKGADGNNSGTSNLEIRLNRALEEIENQKSKYKMLETDQRDAKIAHEKMVKKWSLDVQQQEKDKAELYSALRKQAKLIDILKRQKLHIEAARQLAFTEDEFVKILESASDPTTA